MDGLGRTYAHIGDQPAVEVKGIRVLAQVHTCVVDGDEEFGVARAEKKGCLGCGCVDSFLVEVDSWFSDHECEGVGFDAACSPPELVESWAIAVYCPFDEAEE